NGALILLKEVPEVPSLLSTSFHITQGGVEVSEVKWDDRQAILSGVCQRVPGAQGDLFFYVPEGFDGMACTVGGEAMPVRAAGPKVWKVGLAFKESALLWQVTFQRTMKKGR
ncbi:MAG: hypothetical protein V1800_17955, partial [Candidatus Latescibacterota bacterium]